MTEEKRRTPKKMKYPSLKAFRPRGTARETPGKKGDKPPDGPRLYLVIKEKLPYVDLTPVFLTTVRRKERQASRETGISGKTHPAEKTEKGEISREKNWPKGEKRRQERARKKKPPL